MSTSCTYNFQVISMVVTSSRSLWGNKLGNELIEIKPLLRDSVAASTSQGSLSLTYALTVAYTETQLKHAQCERPDH